jgi:hypothetical protein
MDRKWYNNGNFADIPHANPSVSYGGRNSSCRPLLNPPGEIKEESRKTRRGE